MNGIFTCTLNNHLVNVSSKEELDKSLIWELRIKQTSEVLITKKIKHNYWSASESGVQNAWRLTKILAVHAFRVQTICGLKSLLCVSFSSVNVNCSTLKICPLDTQNSMLRGFLVLMLIIRQSVSGAGRAKIVIMPIAAFVTMISNVTILGKHSYFSMPRRKSTSKQSNLLAAVTKLSCW